MNLKPSLYNFIVKNPENNANIIFNSRTGALSLLGENQYQQYDEFIKHGTKISDNYFLEKLVSCGYLLTSNVNEKFLIRMKMMQERYNPHVLSLTIIPTMACNFRCIYCFEQDHHCNKQMDPSTVANILNFIQKRMKTIGHLNISWYGGEPLLAIPIIRDFSKKVIDLCKENQVSYTAGIITNGYLLTKDVAEQLKECQINKVQITLDGPQEIHDVRRPLVNGKGSFETIMKNLIDIKGILPINLRINVDYSNLDVANDLIQELKENQLLDFVSFYPAAVAPINDSYQKEKCIPKKEYISFALQFFKKNGVSLQSLCPRPRGNYCTADFCNSWIFDNNGQIYKCYTDMGIPERSVGKINNGKIDFRDTQTLEQYMCYDPTIDSKCTDCKMLPICLGGCPRDRIDNIQNCKEKHSYIQEYILECAKAISSHQS